MRLRVFHAPSVGAAMARVRDELGPDALLLASRAVDDGFEITAAHDARETPAPLRLDESLPDALRWHGVPSALASQWRAGDLIGSLADSFAFASLPCGTTDRPLLLVGSPGAGKTMTTARLATRLKLGGVTAQVVTADGRRAGAAEQLASFTRLLGLTLIVADTPAQLTRALARRPQDAPALIDMPGLNPAEPADRDFLRECREATNGTVALVLPAGLDPAESAEIAEAFHSLGAAYLVATRLDQSRRLGGILAAASAGLVMTDAGIGAGVADGLAPITPALLAERLLAAPSPRSQPIPAPLSPLALLARPNDHRPADRGPVGNRPRPAP